MPGPRQKLSVLEGNGRKHLTKAEKAQRAQQEVNLPKPKSLRVPKWLPEAYRKEFRALARELGLARIWIKDESARFGCNAFKALGASYAVAGCLSRRLGEDLCSYGTLTDEHIRLRFQQLGANLFHGAVRQIIIAVQKIEILPVRSTNSKVARCRQPLIFLRKRTSHEGTLLILFNIRSVVNHLISPSLNT